MNIINNTSNVKKAKTFYLDVMERLRFGLSLQLEDGNRFPYTTLYNLKLQRAFLAGASNKGIQPFTQY